MNATNNTTKPSAISAAVKIVGDIGALGLTFANGQRLDLATDQLSQDILLQATLHGLKQKLVDAAAISRNPETGRSATVADKYEAVKEVYDRLLAGEWNKRRASGEGQSTGGLLFKALCRMFATKTPDDIRAFIAAKTKEEQAALRANAKVAAIIAEIKAEEAKDTDTSASDNLLAGLEG